jgi:hypothetical protein
MEAANRAYGTTTNESTYQTDMGHRRVIVP